MSRVLHRGSTFHERPNFLKILKIMKFLIFEALEPDLKRIPLGALRCRAMFKPLRAASGFNIACCAKIVEETIPGRPTLAKRWMSAAEQAWFRARAPLNRPIGGMIWGSSVASRSGFFCYPLGFVLWLHWILIRFFSVVSNFICWLFVFVFVVHLLWLVASSFSLVVCFFDCFLFLSLFASVKFSC